MSRVFWDTNLFIYLLEGGDERAGQVASLAEGMEERGDQLYTSTITLGEVLVKPLEQGRQDLVGRYETALSPPAVVLIPFDRACARIYARLRTDRTIGGPPTRRNWLAPRKANCDLFVTNDERLSRKLVPGVQFIVPLGRAFL